MDVTPGHNMFIAMSRFVDSAIGEAPSPLAIGPMARKIREQRAAAFEFLHKLVAIAMREGVNRAVIEARKRQAGILEVPQDKEDANARAKATDDAHASKELAVIEGARPA